MSAPNSQEMILEAVARILQGITDKQLEPLMVAKRLQRIADNRDEKLLESLESFANHTEQFSNQLKTFLELLRDDVTSLSTSEDVLAKSITELGLSARSRKAINRRNIQTIGDLTRTTTDDLLVVKNFGFTSLNEIRDKLAKLGLKLQDD